MKDLLLIELNEIDFDFLSNASNLENRPHIKKLLSLSKITTHTQDKEEGHNLDPWVQWVSIHTGLPSSVHNVFNFSNRLSGKFQQTWDLLADKGYTCSIWGAMNSRMSAHNNILHYLPDPWNFDEKANSKSLNNFLEFPRYFAGNYKSLKIKNLISPIFKLFTSIISENIFFDIIRKIPFFIKSCIKSNTRIFIFYLILDLITLKVIKKRIKNKKPSFLLIFLNSSAHFQHNQWDREDIYDIYFDFIELILKDLFEIKNNYESIIVANGFSQIKIQPKYLCKIKDPNIFFKDIGLSFKSIEANMTTGGTILFNNDNEKETAKNFLQKFSINNNNVFYLKDSEKLRLYYRLDLVLNKKIKHVNELKNNFIIKPIIKNTIILKDEYINIFTKLFNNLSFIKSTSIHGQTGDLYNKNVSFDKDNINNYELHNYILRHFE